MLKYKNKLLAILLSALLVSLSGCGKIIDQKDIQLANDYCSDKEGLFSIEVESSHTVKYITCRNGDKADSNQAMKAN